MLRLMRCGTRSLICRIALLAAIIPMPTPAEEELPLSNRQFLRDHAETRGFTLGRPTHAQPTPSGDAVLFLRGRARTPKLELYSFDVRTGQTELLLTPEDILKGGQEKLSAEERALRERMRVSVGGFTGFQLSKDGEQILLSLSGRLYVVPRRTRAVQELKTGPGAPIDAKFSPDGQQVSYVLDHDVYVYDLAGQQARSLTTGGTEKVSHGLAEFVAREEMDRFSGYWWSPDSKSLVYQETDATGVEVWYVADPAKPGEPPYPSFYPRPGKANVSVRLGVLSVAGGPTVWIEWDRQRYPYVASVIWDDHGPLSLVVLTRDQKELLLLQANPATGETAVLLRERDPAWVNIRQDVPQWLARGRGFLWASERSGAWQLEWRRTNGELEKVLVPAEFGFRALVDVQADTGEVVFSKRPDPTQWRLCRTTLESSRMEELTPSGGCHSGEVDRHHSIYVDSQSDLQSMPRTTVHRIDGTLIGELPSVAEEPPFKAHVEFTRIGPAPGYYAALVRPAAFEPQRRYPVIVSVYGGPLPPTSSGVVVASLPAWLRSQWIADQGFVVVSIDGRGTPGRDRAWERAIAHSFGTVPLADQVAGLKALGQTYHELDLDRVGIYGWSFGGYMAALAVLKEPGVFRAAAAGAPPTDWYDYDTCYTERYLGIPPADAASYESASLLTWASQLQRALLLIHGTGDDNVYFRHSLKLVDALFRAGKTCEVLPLSGLTHMVPDPVVNEQLSARIIRHFQRHLGGPKD